jgi:hypothetical protein
LTIGLVEGGPPLIGKLQGITHRGPPAIVVIGVDMLLFSGSWISVSGMLNMPSAYHRAHHRRGAQPLAQ